MLVPEASENLQSVALPLPTPDMDSEALLRLGLAYSSGLDGCPIDRVSAHMIFNLASMKGSLEARHYRREMSQEMDHEEIAEAQRAARRWIDSGSSHIAA